MFRLVDGFLGICRLFPWKSACRDLDARVGSARIGAPGRADARIEIPAG